MNQDKIDYIREHHGKKTVRELSRELNLSRKKIEDVVAQFKNSRTSLSPAPAEPVSPPLSRKQYFLILAGILFFTFLVYARTLAYPFINWDDPKYVVENLDIRNFSAEHVRHFFTQPYVGIYAPLTMISLALDYQLYHFNATGFHITNLMLHLASTGLVFTILLTLSGEWLVAAAVTLIFGVHPVQPESVVWISQRKNVLSFFFFLAAFWLHLKARRDANPESRLRLEAAELICFVLACLAKPLSVMMPPVLLAFDYCYGYMTRKNLMKYLPYFLISLGIGLVSVHIAQSATHGEYIGNSRWTTFLTVLVALMKYLQLMFFPVSQSILYPFPLYRSFFHPHILLSVLGLSGVGIFAFTLWQRDRKLFFWMTWYFILLFPVMNIIPLLDYMQDRWLYLPLIGIFTILFTLLLRRFGRGVSLFAAGLLTVTFTLTNLNRQTVWASPEALWLETRKVSRDYWSSPYYNLGHYYVEQGKFDLAIKEFQKTINRFNHPGAWGAIGTVYTKMGQPEKAVPYFLKALELDPGESAFYNELGLIYKEQKKFDLALEQYDKAIKLDPVRPANYCNRAVALALLGNAEEAEKAFQKSLSLDPDFGDSLINYAGFLFKQKRYTEAQSHAVKFLDLYPRSPYRTMMENLITKARAAVDTASRGMSPEPAPSAL